MASIFNKGLSVYFGEMKTHARRNLCRTVPSHPAVESQDIMMDEQVSLHDTMKYYSRIKSNSTKTWVGVEEWCYRVMQVSWNWKLEAVKHQRHVTKTPYYNLVNCIQSEFSLVKENVQ